MLVLTVEEFCGIFILESYWVLEGFFSVLKTVVLVADTKNRTKKLKWLCSYSVACMEMNGHESH